MTCAAAGRWSPTPLARRSARSDSGAGRREAAPRPTKIDRAWTAIAAFGASRICSPVLRGRIGPAGRHYGRRRVRRGAADQAAAAGQRGAAGGARMCHGGILLRRWRAAAVPDLPEPVGGKVELAAIGQRGPPAATAKPSQHSCRSVNVTRRKPRAPSLYATSCTRLLGGSATSRGSAMSNGAGRGGLLVHRSVLRAVRPARGRHFQRSAKAPPSQRRGDT